MTNIIENPNYESAIYQLAQTDLIDAGTDGSGIANLQARQLANRTAYLKAQTDLLVSMSRIVGEVVYLPFTLSTNPWVDANGWYWFSPDGTALSNGFGKYQNLYLLLWSNPNYSINGGKGTSAASDWAAGKILNIPDMEGRSLVMAGAGAGLTVRSAGQSWGAESNVISINQMPSHSHNVAVAGFTATALSLSGGTGYSAISFGAGPTPNQQNIPGNQLASNDNLGSIRANGGGAPVSTAQPSKAYSEVWWMGTK